MKLLQLKLLLTLFLCMISSSIVAHDIAVANNDGVTIYYVWANNNHTELSVSYKGSYPSAIDNEYAGNVIIPENVTYHGNTYSVTSIDRGAFHGCSRLTGVTIPNSITSIGGLAFVNCYGLTSVTIPNSVTSIDEYTFCGCSSLTSFTIPNSVTIISQYAFAGCSGLTSIIIPNSVTNIDIYAFAGCSNLNSVTIGTGVLSIGAHVFDNFRPAKVIWLTNTPPSGYRNATGTVNYVANELYTSLDNITVYPFLSSMFEVDGVKYVPVSPSDRTCDAIDCCYDDSAETIHIGKTVTNKGVTLTVKQVQPYALYGNPYVRIIDLSYDGNVGDCTFQDCTTLETAMLGGEITSLEKNAFSGCLSLKSIIIPESVKSIGENAFGGCSSLTDLQIGNSVETINTYAFSGCTSLPAIRIPQAVLNIKNSAFYQCNSLKNIIIEDRETILNLGSNRKVINDYGNPLFSDCPLESVYIGGNISYNTSSDYGYSPFYRNTSLRTVVITDKETEISENEFYGCTNLRDVKIGDGVESFGDWAFSGCSSLKHLSFGTSVKSIGKEAFSDCSAVTQIVSRAATAPTCGSQALDDINKWDCTLLVPANSIAAYQKADQWKEFFFIKDIESGIADVYKEAPIEKYYYAPNGKLLDKPQKGLNIVVMQDGTTRKVVVK